MPTVTATFQPAGAAGKDTYMRADGVTANYNYGLATTVVAGEHNAITGGVFRGLIQFDLSSIPPTAVCTSAVLSLYQSSEAASNARTMRVYRVLRAWTEGSGTGSATGDGATWNTCDGSNGWGTAGCSNTTSDREASAIGSISLSDTEANGWKDIPLTASAVQDWWDGGITNNGMLLQNDTEADDAHTFRTSDYSADPTLYPKLIVTYTTGTAAPQVNYYRTRRVA